jgi:hypothetical protein
MKFRPLTLCALLLGLAAGCSKPITQDPMPDNSKPTQPETPATGAAQGQPVTYTVRNSGVRCFAAPCPTHKAKPSSPPDAEEILIHEIDFQDLNPSEEQRTELQRKADENPDGLKVEAVLVVKPKAGPAGDATVLRVKKVLQ